MTRGWAIALAIAALVSAGPTGVSADATRHSGTLTEVDRGEGTVTIDEVGPWQLRDGQTVVTPRTVFVTPATEFVQAKRRDEAVPGAWPGGFAEQRIAVDQIKPGDFVTLEVILQDGRATARKVTLVRVHGS